MKGIILAGGKGTRLYPLTNATTKALLPVYDKPMIYYPLTTLMENGITEIAIIGNKEDIPIFKNLLKDGSQWGIKIKFLVQAKPKGIAEAFIIAKKFIGKDNVSLILGDNIFSSPRIWKAFNTFKSGACVFGYQVDDPERYGVVEINSKNQVISIEEKPENPKSDYAIPGLYIFDNKVISVAEKLEPSQRGELEITDVIKVYLGKETLKVLKLPRGTAWLDAGTNDSLYESSSYVRALETRQGVKIGCPEETALTRKLIDKNDIKSIIDDMPYCEYRVYLEKILKRK